MKAFYRVDDDYSLVPHDEATQKYTARRKVGEIIVADIRIARNYENHKRFFSFINTTFGMQEYFTEPEAYRKWLTMKAGYFNTIVAPNGKTIFEPQSIAFESMPEDEFRKLFSACVDVFLKELGRGLSESELLRAVDYG